MSTARSKAHIPRIGILSPATEPGMRHWWKELTQASTTSVMSNDFLLAPTASRRRSAEPLGNGTLERDDFNLNRIGIPKSDRF